LAAFGAEIGLALTRSDRLDVIMERCAKAMSQYLNAAIAQISTFKEASPCLQSLAVAGPLADNEDLRNTVTALDFDFEALKQGKPCVVKQIPADATVPQNGILKHGGITS